MSQRKQTPGTGADGKSFLPLIMAAGVAFGLGGMVLRKRREDRGSAPRAALRAGVQAGRRSGRLAQRHGRAAAS